MSKTSTTEERELNLVLKLELRIGNADTDEKLQALLQTYLAPLILKLASPHTSVRNKVIGICQYISRRLKSSATVSLPLAVLLQQFHAADNAFVKQFDLLYINQGLERISMTDGVALLPNVLKASIPNSTFKSQSSEGKTWSVAFHFLLRLLRTWTVPGRLGKEAVALKNELELSVDQADVLSYWLTRFLLHDGRSPTNDNPGPGLDQTTLGTNYSNMLDQDEIGFFSQPTPDGRSNLLVSELQKVNANIANFLFLPIFSDRQRFLPAIILTSDPSLLDCFRIGDTMLKQCDFDLESAATIDQMLRLYAGKKTRIQIKILTLLSRSKTAATKTSWLAQITEMQLKSPGDGLEASKLRTALFSLVDWTVKLASKNDLSQIRAPMLGAMKDFIESQGWPSPQYTIEQGETLSPAQVEVRSQAYSCIGTLAATSDVSFDVLKFLFTSLRCDTSHQQVHEAINEALGRVISFFSASTPEVTDALKHLLFLNMTTAVGLDDSEGYQTAYSARYPAIKCANKCLPFHDTEARYLDLLAIMPPSQLGTDLPQVREEGLRGLDPYLHRSTQRADLENPGVLAFELPEINPLVLRFFEAQSSPSEPLPPLTSSGTQAAVTFCWNVMALQILKGIGKALDIGPEWKRQLDAIVANDEQSRRAIQSRLRSMQHKSVQLLLKNAFAGLYGRNSESAVLATELLSLAPNEVLSGALTSDDVSHLQESLDSTNITVQRSAARCYGIISSMSQYTGLEGYVQDALSQIQGWQEAIGQDFIKLRGRILSTSFAVSRRWLRGSSFSNKLTQNLTELLMTMLIKSKDQMLKDACYICISQLCLTSPDGASFDMTSGIIDQILPRITEDAKKENEVAVNVMGRLIRWMSTQKYDETITRALDILYALHEIRKPELHFTVGEALAVAVAGWRSTSLTAEFDVDAERPVQATDETLLADVLNRCIKDSKSTKPSLKKASSIWLLSLIQYCGTEDIIRGQLRACQAAFMSLLSDRDELVQETGSRGLSLVYEMGDKVVRENLVRDLVQSFTGNTGRLGGSVTEDTQLFEPGALPTEGGSSVTTYKDIISLANEVGDPSLVYRFMNLASNNAIWSSRAAFGRFGLSNILANSDYLSANKKFYPKLYRYRFDPNPNVQRSMYDIWKALVQNPNAVIEENFDLIMEDLLKSLLGKEWRVREASCAAIANLVQDRDVEKYEKYLDDIWTAAFKVVDDIKETVRAAALTLCRTLVNLLIRNLEVGDGMTKRAGVMLDHALEFLLKQFSTGGSQDVQLHAVSSLLEIVTKCPLKALRRFAPALLENLITSLSSLEHESVNYLHLNADRYGLTADKLDSMRVTGVNASPVTQSIDRCLEALDTASTTEDSTLLVQQAMKKLENVFRESIGLPSKVGLSRVLVTLVVRHRLMFQPYADRFIKLTRKSIVDRNTTISISFATALAYLMRVASEKQVRETAKYAQGLYFDSDQSSNRALAGEIIQAFSKVANDIFMRFATDFVPFVFVGRNDTDSEVRSRFEATWQDNLGGSRSVLLYLQEIVTIINTNIKSVRWSTRHACCLATADLIRSSDANEQYSRSQAELIWPVLQEAVAGKTWEGKEKVIVAFPQFVKKAKCLWDEAGSEMRLIALREAKRTNAQYRPHAILALGQFARAKDDLDLSQEILPYLRKVVEDLTTVDPDRMDTGVDGAEQRKR